MSIDRAKRVLRIEARAVERLIERIDERFSEAVDLLLACRGKVAVVGIGKSGIIGRKIAATLSSTGAPAFFVHPAEGVHGDVGMIDRRDVVVLISNSGETAELIAMVPVLKRLGVPVIGLLGRGDSTIGKAADVVVDVSVEEEACPLQLAPTASTTAALAMGDALAIALLERRGFCEEDFARLHPAGSLGKKLILKVSDVMRPAHGLPAAGPDTPFKDLVYTMSSGMLGHALVMEGSALAGVVTDGDLRRAMERGADLSTLAAADVMTENPKTIGPDELAASAIRMMEAHSITGLVVVAEGAVAGFVHLHDLLREGVV